MGLFQIGFRRMAPTKTVVIDKLFGGAKHGHVVRLDERVPRMLFPQLHTSSLSAYMRTSMVPDSLVGYDTNEYSRRTAVCGTTKIIYFADAKADEKRAFEMLTNYMLRGARVISSR